MSKELIYNELKLMLDVYTGRLAEEFEKRKLLILDKTNPGRYQLVLC